MFSEVELYLNFAVWHYAGINKPMATAVLGPLRVEDCSGKLRRIINSQDLKGERIDELLALLDQIKVIQAVRNDLIHFGSDPNTFVVSTALLAYKGKDVRVHVTSTKILQDMTADLFIIRHLLDGNMHSEYLKVARRPGLKLSWLYTPPPQLQSSGGTQGQRRGRKPPRPPFPA
jgi:hypothetical protein